MSIPKGWLCYLSPEIMRSLRVHTDEGEDLPFTKDSDVYAFGTVWYEMLTGEWPWKAQPPETIIWLVGRGMKPSLANLQASRDVKDILVRNLLLQLGSEFQTLTVPAFNCSYLFENRAQSGFMSGMPFELFAIQHTERRSK